jgi:hypothetical protein
MGTSDTSWGVAQGRAAQGCALEIRTVVSGGPRADPSERHYRTGSCLAYRRRIARLAMGAGSGTGGSHRVIAPDDTTVRN